MWCEGDECRHSVEPLEVVWTSDGYIHPELCPLCTSMLALDPPSSPRRSGGEHVKGENDSGTHYSISDTRRAVRGSSAGDGQLSESDTEAGSVEPVLRTPDGRPVVAVEVEDMAAGQVEASRNVRDADHSERGSSDELATLQQLLPGCVRIRHQFVGRVQARSLVAGRGVSGYPVAAVPYRAGHSCQVRILGLGLSQRLVCNRRRKA